MELRRITDQPNQYNTTNGKFKREGDRIVITTNKENVREIEVNYNIDDLIGVDDVQIRFIVRLDGQLYTSTSLINDLKAAREENNPYFTLDYITIVDINQDLISDTINTLGERETKVGVSMTKTLDTPEDVIKQIDWATRSVPVDGSESSHAEEIGQWTVDGFGDSIFDVDNSVTVKEPEPPEQPSDEDDGGDDTDTNGSEPDTDDEDDELSPPSRQSLLDSRKVQPRTGGGGGNAEKIILNNQQINQL